MTVQSAPARSSSAPSSSSQSAGAELDRQLRTLLDLGYPALAGLSAEELTARVEALRPAAFAAPTRPGAVPFVVVVSRTLVPAEASLPLLDRGGKPGFVSADLADIGRFVPADDADRAPADVYLLVDVERGDDYLDRTPDEAVPAIRDRDRTPLTWDEGVALLTHRPDLLEPGRCFMTPASRCGDRRVPALWISGGTGKDGRERRGAPKLGWCWAGNRHTWLGHASAATRTA
ncbi:DUF5701 family protein [Thalassiella azotivora]